MKNVLIIDARNSVREQLTGYAERRGDVNVDSKSTITHKDLLEGEYDIIFVRRSNDALPVIQEETVWNNDDLTVVVYSGAYRSMLNTYGEGTNKYFTSAKALEYKDIHFNRVLNKVLAK